MAGTRIGLFGATVLAILAGLALIGCLAATAWPGVISTAVLLALGVAGVRACGNASSESSRPAEAGDAPAGPYERFAGSLQRRV